MTSDYDQFITLEKKKGNVLDVKKWYNKLQFNFGNWIKIENLFSHLNLYKNYNTKEVAYNITLRELVMKFIIKLFRVFYKKM